MMDPKEKSILSFLEPMELLRQDPEPKVLELRGIFDSSGRDHGSGCPVVPGWSSQERKVELASAGII